MFLLQFYIWYHDVRGLQKTALNAVAFTVDVAHDFTTVLKIFHQPNTWSQASDLPIYPHTHFLPNFSTDLKSWIKKITKLPPAGAVSRRG